MRKSLTFKICLSSLMAALSIVLDLLSVKVDVMSKITIYGLPLMFTSLFFGPFVGFLSGLASGFISQIIQYGITLSTPVWMIAPIIWGLISGLYIKIIKPKKPYSLKNIIIVVILTSFFATFANTLALYLDAIIWHYTNEQTIVTILSRLLIALIMCIPYTCLLYLLCNRLYAYSWLKK